MNIDAKTRVMAVIGDPIEHSLSPLMQNWFITKTGINAIYTAFHVKPSQIAACVAGMKALGISGLNITVPHKASVVSQADIVTGQVKLLGVSNTLHFDGENIHAHVTDPTGFIESLGGQKQRFEKSTVMLFGAGGAATSVAYALGQLKIRQLYITDLDHARAEALAQMCKNHFAIKHVTVLAHPVLDINEFISKSDILINATAVGMHPHTDRSVVTDFSPVGKKHFCYDLIYNPGVTRFMQKAAEKGAEVQNGLGMLIHQGLASFNIFTGGSFSLNQQDEAELKSIMNKALGI